MMRYRYVLVLFAVISAALVVRLSAADEDVVFRSDVSLVRVDAQVLDRDNHAITGLRAEDFVLREEGREQPIRSFASENMPVDVLFLLDVSASMRPHVQRIADAAHQALRVMRDNDRMGIMVFDRVTRVRMPFSSDRREVERQFQVLLDQENFHGGTDITRGMYDAVDYVQRQGRRDARRAIVILTDDETERNRDEDGVERALARADTVMCALIAPDAMRSRRTGPYGGGPMGGGPTIGGGLGGIILGQPRGGYGGRRGGMQQSHTQSAGTAEIARRSGGDSMPVDDAYALESTLQRLRQRYALFFSLPAGARSGDQRSISLDLTDAARRRYASAEVRYRREYYVPSGMRPAPGGSEQPTVITRAPSGTSDDDQRPILRRPAVSQGSGLADGPLSNPSPAPAPAAPAANAPAASAPANPQPAPAATQNQTQPSQGGWRKLKPGEQQ